MGARRTCRILNSLKATPSVMVEGRGKMHFPLILDNSRAVTI